MVYTVHEQIINFDKYYFFWRVHIVHKQRQKLKT